MLKENTIILIRHGKPDIFLLPNSQKKINSNKLKFFLEQYDLAAIDKDYKPKVGVYQSLQQIKIAFTSEMKRAIATFQYCELPVNTVSDKIFNEAGLPQFNFSFLKLKPKCWMALLRTLWFMGYSKQCESKKQIKKRATIAANILFNESNNNGIIALFGHGVFNYFLKKELLKRGGSLKSKWNYRYWACNVFVFKTYHKQKTPKD